MKQEYNVGDTVIVSYLGSEFNALIVDKRLITGDRLREAQKWYPELTDCEYEYKGADTIGDARILTRFDIIRRVD